MELIKNIQFSQILKNIFIALLATVVLAISSKIKIPFYPVPMTMQTFVVLFIGVAFGWKMGVGIITLYICEGMAGLPVFSGTPEKGIGLVYFTGPTMGYLLGFLITVYLTGIFNFKANIIINFFKLFFATSFIYILGILWLGFLIGWDKPLFELGAKPFLLAELFKILLILFLIPKINKLKKII
tara:strand:- start:629 stop:1180 length:552 start_codon:yes stop_codon:yes gene_type:complete